jgi:hypothetical protein
MSRRRRYRPVALDESGLPEESGGILYWAGSQDRARLAATIASIAR